MPNPYARGLEELATHAVRYWPAAVSEQEAAISILPLLLDTQDKFISILTLADKEPDSWKSLVDVSRDMPANLFLKHLMVITNVGGELLGKITPFDKHFEDGQMGYIWRDAEYTYDFKAFRGKKKASNANLFVAGGALVNQKSLTPEMEDVVMFLLYGATSVNDTLTLDIKNPCIIGDFMGKPEELNTYIKQSYIRISRQLAGATNNALGQIAQDFVYKGLADELPGWTVKRNGTIEGITFNAGRTEATFDVVAKSPGGIYFGVEVSFQVTGNSVIERKARDAQALQENVHSKGYVCYVIDGAGNIDVRRSAVRTICQYSDCTVAFSPEEISYLAQFCRETANE